MAMLIAITLTTVSCASALKAGESVLGINEEWEALYPFQQDGLWGYSDGVGDVVIEPIFLIARSFSEGLAFVTIGERVAIGEYVIEQRGFIDSSGEIIIQLSLDGVFVGTEIFSEGFALVINRGWDFENERPNIDGVPGPFIFIDRTGYNVFGQEFLYANSFKNGTALVSLASGNAAFIDRAGQNTFGREFEFASDFDEYGYARVTLLNGQRRYLNRSGQLVRNRT